MRRLLYIPIVALSAVAGAADVVLHLADLGLEWLFDKAEG